MPDSDNPDDIPRGPVEEAVRGNNHFAMGKLREFWDLPAGFRKISKPSQAVLTFLAVIRRRHRAILADILQRP
jgi:hypothetical protein